MYAFSLSSQRIYVLAFSNPVVVTLGFGRQLHGGGCCPKHHAEAPSATLLLKPGCCNVSARLLLEQYATDLSAG